MDQREITLPHVIQYRRKDAGIAWRDMAAFDVIGPAETYFAQQGGENSPWEYRLIDLTEKPLVAEKQTEAK